MSAQKKLFIIEAVLLAAAFASYGAMLCIKVPSPSAPQNANIPASAEPNL